MVFDGKFYKYYLYNSTEMDQIKNKADQYEILPKTLFISLAMLGFLVQGDNTVISPILPDIASDLNIFISEAAYAVAGYLIPFGLFALLHGPLADRFGQDRQL